MEYTLYLIDSGLISLALKIQTVLIKDKLSCLTHISFITFLTFVAKCPKLIPPFSVQKVMFEF